MGELSQQNLKRVHRELDEVGTAISVVGTRRQKLMELARLTGSMSDELVGTRPEVKRVRDDLVRLTHNVRRARTRARPASQAVKALAAKVKDVQKLVSGGLGDVPEAFTVGDVSLLNTWGYTKSEVRPFTDALKRALDVIEKMGLTKAVAEAKVSLDPDETPQASMKYDLFSDTFVANATRTRERGRGISDALGGRLWLKLFEKRDVETWGGATVAWSAFSDAFHRLLTGRRLSKDDSARMAVSLGRVIGPERWRKVA